MQWPDRTNIAEMLYKIKYNKKDKSKIEPLAEEICKFMKTRLVTKWLSIIIPVPPSDTQREFQPVIEIAKSIGKKLKIGEKGDTGVIVTVENRHYRLSKKWWGLQ